MRNLRKQHEDMTKMHAAQEAKDSRKAKEDAKMIEDFYAMLDKSEDLTDNLDELANFLCKFTGATGVYIGKLEKPRKEIGEDDDDKAHADRENPKVIRYIYSSKDQEFMRG